jgi:hypothetical protein
MNMEISTGEVLTKAMANRSPISFQYNKLGLFGEETKKEQIGNARIILISTSKSGQSTIMLDLPQNKQSLNKSRGISSWRYFDINNMSDIQISSS